MPGNVSYDDEHNRSVCHSLCRWFGLLCTTIIWGLHRARFRRSPCTCSGSCSVSMGKSTTIVCVGDRVSFVSFTALYDLSCTWMHRTYRLFVVPWRGRKHSLVAYDGGFANEDRRDSVEPSPSSNDLARELEASAAAMGQERGGDGGDGGDGGGGGGRKSPAKEKATEMTERRRGSASPADKEKAATKVQNMYRKNKASKVTSALREIKSELSELDAAQEGQGTGVAASDDEWECVACTFRNGGSRTHCEMCDTPKPPPAK